LDAEVEGLLAQAEGMQRRRLREPDHEQPRRFVQAYNAQAAMADKAQIIVTYYRSHNAADYDALALLLDAVTSYTGATPAEFSADSGYCSEANLADLARRGNCLMSPPQVPSTPTVVVTDNAGCSSQPCAGGSDTLAGVADIDCASRLSKPSWADRGSTRFRYVLLRCIRVEM
jgi:hypothetical protein